MADDTSLSHRAPDPEVLYPQIFGPHHGNVHGHPRVAFLKPLVHHPFTSVGEYTYYDDPDGVTEFERRNVLHHYGPHRLVIGRYCALATGVTFLMAGGSHELGAVSTYPFPLMGGAWGAEMSRFRLRQTRGDTVVGNDVWFGHQALVMPGVTIGDGAVIAARAVVSRDVPPYAVVSGNPAREVRRRFPPEVVDRLLELAWWDWPVEEVTRHLGALTAPGEDGLELLVRRGATAAGERGGGAPAPPAVPVTARGAGC